jgi:hypothetical protein
MYHPLQRRVRSTAYWFLGQMIKPMISLAGVYHLFIEVIAIINKKLLIRYADGPQLMVPRNRPRNSVIIISAHAVEMKRLERPSLSKLAC